MNIKDIRVFVCVPGTGKTYLARKDNRFVDIEDIRAEYSPNAKDFTIDDDEIEFIRRKTKAYLIATDKILLYSSNQKIVQMLNEEKIPYCLICNSIDVKNQENANYLNPELKIKLKKGEFLSSRLLPLLYN